MRLRTSALARSAPSLIVIAAVLGGCGSSTSGNGVAAKPPVDMVLASKAAADGAKSTHVAGSIVSAGQPITLDLNLVAGKGGRGRLSESGLSFEVIALGGTVYIKGSSAFYSHFAGPAAAQLLQGKWLKAPASSANFASLASVIDLRKLVDTTLANHGALAKGATTTVNGQPAVAVSDTSRGGTLYIATKGPPYPIEVTKGGAGGGKITFDHWNESIPLSTPANAIDLSQLQSLH